MRPLVSVIAAVRNPDEVAHAEGVVSSQTYPNLELVCPDLGRDFDALWDDGSTGAPAFHVGTYMAHGDYFAYLLPQDRYSSAHIDKMVDLLESTKAHFAYSQMKTPDGVIGSDPPHSGEIGASCIVHRANLILGENWRDGGPDFVWDLVTRWMGSGWRDETGVMHNAQWAFLNLPTVERNDPAL